MVKIFRRHSDDCKFTKQSETKCSCPIWMQWQQDKQQRRASAQTRDWDHAENLKAQKTLELQRIALGESIPITVRMTLADAVQRYIAMKEEMVTKGTVNNDRRILATLQAFCNKKAVVLLKDVSAALLEEWQGTWTVSRSSKAVYQTKVASFFNWCCRKKSITGLRDNPYTEVDRVRLEECDSKQTPPYTPEEFTAILAAIPKAAAKHNWFAWKTLRMTALILLQRWSGLAATDAFCLERSRLDLETGFLQTYRTKTGNYVGVMLPPFVIEAITACVEDGSPEYFFWSGKGEKEGAAGNYGPAFLQVLEESGVEYEHCFSTTHRVRDTFACEFLGKRTTVAH